MTDTERNARRLDWFTDDELVAELVRRRVLTEHRYRGRLVAGDPNVLEISSPFNPEPRPVAQWHRRFTTPWTPAEEPS